MLGELDQKLNVLAPEDDHVAGSFVAAELKDLLNKVRRSLATADMPHAQIPIPVLANRIVADEREMHAGL